jgi:hypothetical protein
MPAKPVSQAAYLTIDAEGFVQADDRGRMILSELIACDAATNLRTAP